MKIMLAGDSYTFGQGCSDNSLYSPSEFCWGSLISKTYTKFTVMNYSAPGVDNLTIAKQVWENLSDRPDLIIFCSTSALRIQVNDPVNPGKYIFSINPNYDYPLLRQEPSGKKFLEAAEYYYRYLYNDQTGNNYTASAILSAYACSCLIGAEFLWSLQTTSQIKILHQIGSKQFQSMFDFPLSKEEIAPCQHPNDAGHRRYFSQFIEPLLQKYL